MRIARVFHPSSPCPLVALERDGCLYDVAELDRQFGTPPSQREPYDMSDFHLRVFALRGVGLDKLDDFLRGGDRPTEARLSKGSLLWLPPCAAERSVYVQIDRLPSSDVPDELPQYHIGNSRSLFAHQETVPFPFDEPHPEADVAVAALIGEELRSSTVKDVEKAIAGYTILVRWVAPNAEKRSGSTHARSFATSIGPLLVSKDEAGAVEELRVRVRVAGDNRDLATSATSDWSFAEAIAFVSRHVPLMPGDVVAGPPVAGVREALRELGLSFGTTLDVAIERLGKLSSRPVLGPEPPEIRPRPSSKTTDQTESDQVR